MRPGWSMLMVALIVRSDLILRRVTGGLRG